MPGPPQEIPGPQSAGVSAAAAELAGTAHYSNRPGAGTAALLALVQGRRPGRSRGGSGCGCGCRVGAARTPERDVALGMVSDGTAPIRARTPASSRPRRARSGRMALCQETVPLWSGHHLTKKMAGLRSGAGVELASLSTPCPRRRSSGKDRIVRYTAKSSSSNCIRFDLTRKET